MLVGAGGWGRVWARLLDEHARVELAGWYDVIPGAAMRAALEIGVTECMTDAGSLEEALQRTAPDFVVNLTVPSAHREVAVAALEYGVPVLCEKPMADTIENARAMLEASERTGHLLVINQQRRHDPNIIAMRSLVDEFLGSVGLLSSNFFLLHPEQPFHRPMQHPLILDMAIHTFDAARFLTGADPVSVFCQDWSSAWSQWTGRDSAVAIFEMTGGLRYTYQGCWSSQGFGTTWESSWRAIGERGTVIWDGVNLPEAEIMDQPGDRESGRMRIRKTPDVSASSGLEASLDAFLLALDTGTPPMGEAHENIKSLTMVVAAARSAEQGCKVPIADLL